MNWNIVISPSSSCSFEDNEVGGKPHSKAQVDEYVIEGLLYEMDYLRLITVGREWASEMDSERRREFLRFCELQRKARIRNTLPIVVQSVISYLIPFLTFSGRGPAWRLPRFSSLKPR